jgi:hypothetical protein
VRPPRRRHDVDFAAQREKIRAELAAKPPFLAKAWERFADRLERKPLSFVELHGAQGLSPSDLRRLEARKTVRRKHQALIVGVLLAEMDIPSLVAAKLRTDGAFSGLGHRAIAERAGVPLWTVGRVIADFVGAGYLTAHQPIEPYLSATGALAYCAHNSIYRLTELFFRRCHYDQRLKSERRRAAERKANRCRIYGASLLKARSAWRRLRTFGAAEYLPRTGGAPRPRPRPPDR